MASSSTSWMPPAGKYPVNIGSSLGRAIKNRKLKGSPAPTTARRSNLPEREFYSFKFNFKPASVDSTKPATLDIKKGPENSQIVAEYPSTNAGQVNPFTGSELRAKDVDCVLIYDEDTGQYTIEKVESFINLASQRSKAASPRTAIGSPAASTPASTSSVKGKSDNANQDDDDDNNHPVAQRDEEEEPEEGEEIELPPPRAVKPLPTSRLSPKPPKPPPPAPQPRVPPPPAVVNVPPVVKKAPTPPLVAKPRPQPRPKKPKTAAPVPAPAPTTSYPDEEVFNVVRPTKRGRPSPPPAPAPKPAPPPVRKPPVPPPAPVVRPAVSLSLPGGSAVFEPPPPAVLVSASAPVSVPVAAPPMIPSEPASPQMIASDSEDEDMWEEQIPTAAPPAPPAPTNSLPVTAAANNFMDPSAVFNDTTFEEIDGDALFGDDGDGDGDGEDGDGEEGEEIPADFLEGVLNETMEEVDSDEDFIGAAVAKVTDDPPPGQPIMYLNRYMGGVAVNNDSDEDFTSSDESDDD